MLEDEYVNKKVSSDATDGMAPLFNIRLCKIY